MLTVEQCYEHCQKMAQSKLRCHGKYYVIDGESQKGAAGGSGKIEVVSPAEVAVDQAKAEIKSNKRKTPDDIEAFVFSNSKVSSRKKKKNKKKT